MKHKDKLTEETHRALGALLSDTHAALAAVTCLGGPVTRATPFKRAIAALSKVRSLLEDEMLEDCEPSDWKRVYYPDRKHDVAELVHKDQGK